MNLPARLKIGAIWWKVRVVPGAEIDSDGATVADQNEVSQTIRIAKELSPEMREVAFFHELLHCIDSQLDHDLVELLAQALYQVLKDNKLLAK